MPTKLPDLKRETLCIRLDPKTRVWLNMHHVRNIGRFIDQVVARMSKCEDAQHVRHSHD